MSKPGVKEDLALFLQSIEEQAENQGFETASLIDKGKTLGLIIYETGRVVSQVARLLRNTAFIFADKEGDTDFRSAGPIDSCRVTVEERAQLFDFFGKGAGQS